MEQEQAVIRELLRNAKVEASRQCQLIMEQNPLSRTFLREHITDYVLAKFLLTGAEAKNEQLNDLVELSLSHSMKISKELVKEFDMAKSCGGTSSAMAKKALLFMSIQRDYGLELRAEGSARLKNLDELTALIWEAMEHTEFWKTRLCYD